MEQLKPQVIANLLVLGIVLAIAIGGFFSWCKRRDDEWAKRNPPLFPPELNDAVPVPPVSDAQKEIAAKHTARRISGHSVAILGDMTGLRKDLPPVRNMEGAAQAKYPIYRYSNPSENGSLE